MRFEDNGISLWYDTPDAPAPRETVSPGTEIPITIGIWPADASNQVQVHYQINQGPMLSVAASFWRNVSTRQIHYFRAYLPAFRVGDVVKYGVMCCCVGRQVPKPDIFQSLASSFRVSASADRQTPSSPPMQTSLSEPEMTGSRREVVSPASPVSKPKVPSPRASAITSLKEQRVGMQHPFIAGARQRFIPHKLRGQLLHEETGKPLAGFSVRAFDLDAGAEARNLGRAVSDDQGMFTLAYTTPDNATLRNGQRQNTQRLRFQVCNPGCQEIHRTEKLIQPDQKQPLELRVHLQCISDVKEIHTG